MNLAEFLQSSLRNTHLQERHMVVYARKGNRAIGGALMRTLDVADVTVEEEYRSNGVFKEWLAAAETLASIYGFDAVYVENLLNDQLKDFLLRRGYAVRDDGCRLSPSLYKLLANIPLPGADPV